MADTATLQTIPETFQASDLDQQEMYFYDDTRRVPTLGLENPTYMDISNSPTIKSEFQDEYSLMSWTQKHPEHWTSSEVLDWIYFLADRKNVDCTTLRGEAFQNLSGHQLSMMTLSNYIDLDPEYGQYLYEMYRSLYRDASFIGPSVESCDQYSYVTETIKTECSEQVDMTGITDKLLDGVFFNEKEMRVRLGEHWYPIDVTGLDLEDIIYRNDFPFLSSPNSESDSSSDTHPDDYDTRLIGSDDTVRRLNSTGSDVFSDEEALLLGSNMASKKPQTQKTRKPRRPRPVSTSGDDSDEKKTNNRGRKQGQLTKGNHLWEFIRDLLKDPKYNPQMLRWEERDTGVFRFVQSEAVARMWGRKKNNPGMTYEKLSRAMRFCRSAGYFAQVPKTGKFPKKLCFRFGPKASGWGEML